MRCTLCGEMFTVYDGDTFVVAGSGSEDAIICPRCLKRRNTREAEKGTTMNNLCEMIEDRMSFCIRCNWDPSSIVIELKEASILIMNWTKALERLQIVQDEPVSTHDHLPPAPGATLDAM